MSSTVRLFPVLNDTLKENAMICVSVPDFSYMLDGADSTLQLQDMESEEDVFNALLRDPKCSWFPDNNELYADWTVEIGNPECLFGAEGIAPLDAVIGIAVRWASSGTEQQNSSPFGEFSFRDKRVSVKGNIEFPKGFLKSSLRMEFVLYLKKPGRIKREERHLCNQSGIILGSIGIYQIYIDGNGSVFPILTEEDKSGPLWRIVQTSYDVMSDKFDDDSIAIYLNQAHPDYHLIDQESPDYCISFFAEVLSDALTLLTESVITEAKAQGMWDDILSGDNYEEDSIAAAVHYFIKKLGWNPENILTLSESIHRYIDKNLKGELK